MASGSQPGATAAGPQGCVVELHMASGVGVASAQLRASAPRGAGILRRSERSEGEGVL